MKVKLESKTIEVKKLPLGKYAELLNAVEELPKRLGEFSSLSEDTLLQSLPKIIASAFPDFVKIICIATPLEEEEVYEMGLDEAVDVIMAVIEVNNYQKVFSQIKNLTAQQSVIQKTN